MRINLPDGYYIKDDGIGFWLGRIVIPKPTEERVIFGKVIAPKQNPEPIDTNICYPSTLESAIRRYAREANLDYEGDWSGYFDRLTKTIEEATRHIPI